MRPKKLIPLLILCLCVLIILPMSCSIVEDGQTGVKFTAGHIASKPLNTGFNFYPPFITAVEKWNVKEREIKETANVPSSEGLISTLDVSVLYRITPDNAVSIRKNIGKNYIEVVLIPNIRDTIRNVVAGYSVKSLFSDTARSEISMKIKDRLTAKLEPRGILIRDVLLRDVKLPATLTASIEAKQKAEQEALQKQFELEKAEKDAEIRIAESRGISEANKIINNTLTPEYIRYLFIQALKEGNAEVIYVPTEGNIPIMEATRKMK